MTGGKQLGVPARKAMIVQLLKPPVGGTCGKPKG